MFELFSHHQLLQVLNINRGHNPFQFTIVKSSVRDTMHFLNIFRRCHLKYLQEFVGEECSLHREESVSSPDGSDTPPTSSTPVPSEIKLVSEAGF